MNPSGTVLDVLEMLGNAIYQSMSYCVQQAPDEFKEEIKKDLYDKFNFMASNILSAFDPEAELHPGLTERAILEAENKIIEREYDELTKK